MYKRQSENNIGFRYSQGDDENGWGTSLVRPVFPLPVLFFSRVQTVNLKKRGKNMQEFLLTQGEYILRMLLAAACGAGIGYERKNRLKEAGIRTHLIVALGAALTLSLIHI